MLWRDSPDSVAPSIPCFWNRSGSKKIRIMQNYKMLFFSIRMTGVLGSLPMGQSGTPLKTDVTSSLRATFGPTGVFCVLKTRTGFFRLLLPSFRSKTRVQIAFYGFRGFFGAHEDFALMK